MDEFAAPGRGLALLHRKIGASVRRAGARCNSLIQRELLRRLWRSAKSWTSAAHAICNGLRKSLSRKTYPRCILQRECSLQCRRPRRCGRSRTPTNRRGTPPHTPAPHAAGNISVSGSRILPAACARSSKPRCPGFRRPLPCCPRRPPGRRGCAPSRPRAGS